MPWDVSSVAAYTQLLSMFPSFRPCWTTLFRRHSGSLSLRNRNHQDGLGECFPLATSHSRSLPQEPPSRARRTTPLGSEFTSPNMKSLRFGDFVPPILAARILSSTPLGDGSRPSVPLAMGQWHSDEIRAHPEWRPMLPQCVLHSRMELPF
jgi:hypothetical protein